MAIQTIKWDKGAIKIIDQTLLPNRLVYLNFRDVKKFWHAIKKLQVRGAPALGVAAAYGACLGIKDSRAKDYDEFIRDLDCVIKFIGSARPTAVNLFWGLARMRAAAVRNKGRPVKALKRALLSEAHKIYGEDRLICRRMAEYGADLIRDGEVILTHCNAGALATADYGTALGAIYRAREQGKKIKVYADETRPLLQGARLTTWELMQEGIDVTLICDNMAAHVMSQGKVTKVIVGADRIARNGDVANKIGTYGVAVLAKYHKVPFYVVAPESTIDFGLSDGRHIPIEERHGNEITTIHGKMLAPKGVKTYCPAFDVTPARLVTAIVTEKGVFKPSEIKRLRRGGSYREAREEF